jgi:hypothetical protein
MIDVVVCPYGVKRSISSSRCSIECTCAFMKKQSSPVMRWHSTTSPLFRASSATRGSWRDAGRTRITALSAYPRARGSMSVRYPVIAPSLSSRWSRSATAGDERPTRRPSSARLSQGTVGVVAALDYDGRRLLLAWGCVLALMNCCFYLAISRQLLATVAAIEFVPVVGRRARLTR